MSGFGDRIFLTKEEQDTYKKRAPVRYVKHKKDVCCVVCGGNDRLQNAHLIPFKNGVIKYGLTPDYLDRKENIVTACIGSCNKSVEWDHQKITTHVQALVAKTVR